MKKTIILILVLISPVLIAGDTNQLFKKRIELSDEKSADIRIHFSAGSMQIGEAVSSYLFEGRLEYNEKVPAIKYVLSSSEGFLKIDDEQNFSNEDGNFNFGDLNEIRGKNWELNFTNRIPLNFDLQIGAAKADLDFGGMAVKELNLDVGVSETLLDFSQKNKIRMNKLRIDVGISQFTAKNLLNANFDRLVFDGGMGEYSLDFGGRLDESAEVSVDMGVGSLKIMLPESVPFLVEYEESLFSSVNIESAYQQNGYWYSDNYNSRKPCLKFYVETGMGSVDIIRNANDDL